MKIEFGNEQSLTEDRTSEYVSQASKGPELYSTVQIMGKHMGTATANGFRRNTKIPTKHTSLSTNQSKVLPVL